eukprot:jgi/Botrbrau1/11722/Bobra.0195s0049.1
MQESLEQVWGTMGYQGNADIPDEGGVSEPAAQTLKVQKMEAFSSVSDLILHSIISNNGKANLKQMYSTVRECGRIAYKRADGSRLLTDNDHWKAQIRHTLYTGRKFERVKDEDGYWRVSSIWKTRQPSTTTVWVPVEKSAGKALQSTLPVSRVKKKTARTRQLDKPPARRKASREPETSDVAMLEADDDDMDAYSDVVAGDNTDGLTSGRGTRPSSLETARGFQHVDHERVMEVQDESLIYEKPRGGPRTRGGGRGSAFKGPGRTYPPEHVEEGCYGRVIIQPSLRRASKQRTHGKSSSLYLLGACPGVNPGQQQAPEQSVLEGCHISVSQAASEAAGHGDKGAEAESPGANLYFLRSGTVQQTGSAGLGSNLYPEGTAPVGRGSERQDADSAMHGPKAKYKALHKAMTLLEMGQEDQVDSQNDLVSLQGPSHQSADRGLQTQATDLPDSNRWTTSSVRGIRPPTPGVSHPGPPNFSHSLTAAHTLQAAASSVLQPPPGGDLPDDAVVSSDDPPQVRFLRSHARDPLQTGTATVARDTSQRGFVPYQGPRSRVPPADLGESRPSYMYDRPSNPMPSNRTNIFNRSRRPPL